MTDYTVEDLRIRPHHGEGEVTETDMLIIARSGALGGDFSVMQGSVGPRKLLPPHTHQNEDQLVFIISGELEFEVGGKDGLHFHADAGSYILKPRHVSHTFWNPSETETCHYIELSGRKGFEDFVDGRAKGMVRWQIEAVTKQEIRSHYTEIPRLMRTHGLNGLASVSYGDGEE